MKKILSALLLLLVISFIPLFATANEIPPEMELLNEFTYYTTLIAETENRLYLDDIYDRLMNQYEPKEIDEEINTRLIGMLSGIENIRILDLKKERLQMVFDLQKSNVIASAIPNPINMIGTIALSTSPNRSLTQNVIAGLASAIGTGASSYTMYQSASANLLIEANEKYWDLEYEAMKNVNNLNHSSLSTQNSYGSSNDIPGEYILNEENTKRFINIISDANIARAINNLESAEETYQYFPLYWLERADLYFKNGDFQSCIDTVLYYDNNFNYSQIYRRNERYGQVLVDAIASAINLYYSTDYNYCLELVVPWLSRAEENTAPDDWFQMYYLSVCYLMFADGSNEEFYNCAYDLMQKCGRYLSGIQDSFISSYTSELIEKTKEEKENMLPAQREEYENEFKAQEEARKTELPTTDGGLIESLRMLYSMNQMGIGKINDYASSLEPSIIIPQLREYLFGEKYAEGDVYGFAPSRFTVKKSIWGNSFSFTMPVCLINSETIFHISINDGDFHQLYNESSLNKEQQSLGYTPIEVVKVDRHGSTNINDFDVELKVEIPKEWIVNNDDEAKMVLRIETAYCPIDVVFVGEKLSRLEFGWINKDYSNASFFTDFSSQSLLYQD